MFKNFIAENANQLKQNSIDFVKYIKNNDLQNADRVSQEASNALMNLLINIRKSMDNQEFSDFKILSDQTTYYIEDLQTTQLSAQEFWKKFKSDIKNIQGFDFQDLTIRRFANINAHGRFLDFKVDDGDNHWLCFWNEPRTGKTELIIINVQKFCECVISNLRCVKPL